MPTPIRPPITPANKVVTPIKPQTTPVANPTPATPATPAQNTTPALSQDVLVPANKPGLPGINTPIKTLPGVPVVPLGPIPDKATEVNAQGVKTYRFSGPGPTGPGKATLTWDAPKTNVDGTPINDLAGYKIYFGSEPGKFSHVIDVGNVTNFEITNLPSGEFYCAATAYDTSGNESTLSNEAEKLVK